MTRRPSSQEAFEHVHRNAETEPGTLAVGDRELSDGHDVAIAIDDGAAAVPGIERCRGLHVADIAGGLTDIGDGAEPGGSAL